MIIHNVFIKPKAEARIGDFQELYNHICELEQIPGIETTYVGSNISFEGKDEGFSEGFTILFDNWDSRRAYAINPFHLEFSKKYIHPIAEKVLVYDMEPGVSRPIPS